MGSRTPALISFQFAWGCARRYNITSEKLSGCSAQFLHIASFSLHFLSLQYNQCLEIGQYQVQYDVCRTILQNFREILILWAAVLDIQCEENWCLYEILKFALRVCLQKCSALSLNLKICSILSAFNSAHNAFAEQMQPCYTALGITHQSSRICRK